MNEGWIGAWSPGIGDPSVGGWLTVVLYGLAAWACFRVLQSANRHGIVLGDNERMVWRLLFWGMIALGINKQLDLQSALTELARLHAHEHGWFDQRRRYQQAFIAAVPVMGLTALAVLALLVWKSPPATLWTCAGAAGLVVFVAIRAVSFHHLDKWLGWRLAGLPLNWILEMGSLLVIGSGARRRVRVQA